MAKKPREIVASVLGEHMTARVWTGNYLPVLPFTPQSFAVGAVLPMVLYLFRWGHRRGRGKFNAVFSSTTGKPTIGSVASKLASDPRFDGFRSDVGRAILGDILLTSTLENRRHAEGQDEQVQRCFATHYMASWIDLPFQAGHLRGVPEAIVALITDQESGDVLQPEATGGRYPVGARVKDNELVSAFATGVTVEGEWRNNLRSDRFDEAAEVGLDQLVTIRLAQLCGEAPIKATGKGEPGPIPNQLPIATRAAKTFREDMLTFFDCYGRNGAMPRLSLLPMLESAIAVGLTTILLSTVDIVERWSCEGKVPNFDEQRLWPLFVDCSGSADPALRDLSELSSELVRQQLSRLSTALMYMRLLEFYVINESDIPRQDLPERAPNGAAWLNLLGSIAVGSHDESRNAERFLRGKGRALAEALRGEDAGDPRIDILSNENDGRKHGLRLADVLMSFLDIASARKQLTEILASSLMTNEPNGLARRRRITLQNPTAGGRKTADATSFVLTNTVLEYLVHRHLRKSGKGRKARDISLPDFLKLLRQRYGFCVDQSPPNMDIPNELLQRNRRVLERRLRDLGLLIGVNDAEQMKKLKARYRTAYDLANVEGDAA